MNDVFGYVDAHEEEGIQLLKRLASQPSVSATGEGIEECSDIVVSLLSEIGANPKLYRLDKASPIVAGEIRSKRRPRKTILFYNHYDVQPPEPLDLWETPPFEPSIKEGRMFGRGVADDKGELVGRLMLTKAFLEERGDVPCNFKFLFEGEEEIGSVNLPEYKKKYPKLFESDSVIWEFGGVDPKDRPDVILGVKGIFYVQLNVRKLKRDVHSSWGAVVENPAWRLVATLSTLKKGEEILIPGWYDDVRKLTKTELDLIKKRPYEAEAVKKDFGISHFVDDMTVDEVKIAMVSKPTCTICGLYSGYTGKGSKTVLPAEAFAKIDFRIVPDQDPDKLQDKLVAHLKHGGYSDVKVAYAEGVKAKRTSPEAPIALAAMKAAEIAYGRPAVVTVSSAATGPMYLFDSPAVCIGGGHQFSRSHSPNENLRLDLFVKGMKWVAATVQTYADFVS